MHASVDISPVPVGKAPRPVVPLVHAAGTPRMSHPKQEYRRHRAAGAMLVVVAPEECLGGRRHPIPLYVTIGEREMSPAG